VSAMVSFAVAVAPLASLTVVVAGAPQAAGLPNWWPLRLTAETPGWPRRVHACPDWLVNSR